MTPDLLPAIAAFARVAHHASFTRAARELGVSPSALSQTMRTLEARLGVRLLERTTRRVGLTELGQRFLTDARPALAALGAAVADIDEVRDRPAGLLRINASELVADLLITPHLPAFLTMYPDVTVEVHCDTRFMDLVSHGFDAGVRLEQSVERDMVAIPIGPPLRNMTFAAPSYLARYGVPATPWQLLEHRCLNLRFAGGDLFPWRYEDNGKPFELTVSGPLISNNITLLLDAALRGVGIACCFEDKVRADVDAGRLVPILEPWWPIFPPFCLYYPGRAHMPRKLRVFIDFMRQRSGA
ncbi:DNA-binding transcriptional LysR family regulator [Luteibacter sp. Sphag1AF]|uniref:LysR family transcriptional regulator n=1 Tax=Luteibacter sp. Sphag1AF TaxID=2587031 RepID=UPI001619FB36|nr:LysR family transcriptional regulator [Luteibacter sp. Sphag1AF]MBB3225730.1 DNA-binding transcriptional LysR family regulator [Luteibacter sp. Sphag1AF]